MAFEGDGAQSRAYFTWSLVQKGGIFSSVRSTTPRQAKVMRTGKTERQKANKKWARRQDNHDARKAWDRETTVKGGPKGRRHFPIEVCNGRESQALKHVHKCGRPAFPGQRGGGVCRHRKGKKA